MGEKIPEDQSLRSRKHAIPSESHAADTRLRTSSIGSGSSFLDDLLPPEIIQLGTDAGTVISIFSSAKSAVDVATAVLKVLGVLQDTDVQGLFVQLNQHLDNAVGALSWAVFVLPFWHELFANRAILF